MFHSDEMLGKLHTVLLFGDSPEELDAHKIRPIWGVEAEGNIVRLTPLGDTGASMVAGIVHEDRKLPAWILLLDVLESFYDAFLVKGSVLAVHVDLASSG